MSHTVLVNCTYPVCRKRGHFARNISVLQAEMDSAICLSCEIPMFEAVLRFRDVISHENFPLLYIVAIPAVCGSLKSAGTFTSS